METQWHDLFMATAGAAGALLGLIFVAISISVAKITAIKHLTAIALQPIHLLLSILILSIFMLFPHQSYAVLGSEILATGLVIWTINLIGDVHIYRSLSDEKKKAYTLNIIISQFITTLIMTSGIFIIISGQVGIQMLVFGIIFSFIRGVINSWAILVELNR